MASIIFDFGNNGLQVPMKLLEFFPVLENAYNQEPDTYIKMPAIKVRQTALIDLQHIFPLLEKEKYAETMEYVDSLQLERLEELLVAVETLGMENLAAFVKKSIEKRQSIIDTIRNSQPTLKFDKVDEMAITLSPKDLAKMTISHDILRESSKSPFVEANKVATP